MAGADVSRRQVLSLGVGAGLAAAGSAAIGQGRRCDPDQGVTAPEDLMKEHGVLNRCLLVYEEGLRRLRDREEVPPSVFLYTAQLVRRFVEEYHEHNEETYIFPQFRRAGKLTDLVDTLLTQHRAGRRLTAEIIRLSEPARFRDAANREGVDAACRAFIRMYRPHKAREDTVLFPALRTLLPPARVAALGDRMEGEEKSVLGEEGFERAVAQVAGIEKALGIYNLAEFTPRA